LLKSAEILKHVKLSNIYGVVDCDVKNAKADMHKIQERKKAVVGQLVMGVEGLLKANGVSLIRAEGTMIDKNTIRAGEKTITGENVIIATGSEYQTIPFQADPAMKILNGDDILNLDYIPEDMVILGGGVIAVEFAYFLNSIGCNVSIIVRSRILRTSADEEIAAAVAEQFKKNGIAVYEAAQVKKINKDSVTFEKDGKLQEVRTNYVLDAIGRKPSVRGVPCEKLGIGMNNGAIVTNDRMETSVKGLYAIGDVNGKYMLAHVASMEGIVAVENICNIDSRMSYKAIPSCIYIQPEVAGAGLTEKQARDKYGDVKVGKIPMYTNGKSLVEGDTNGLIKVIVEPELNEIVGVHMYAAHATDMIAEAVLAMDMEATAESAGKSVHPHPTVSEAVYEAFHAATGKAIHSL